ncbi:hypothetical protein Tco_0854769 [Tanacetum coccineum]
MAILMVQSWQRVVRQKITQIFSPYPKISFPPLGDEDEVEGPMIIEAEIGGHFIHRIYVDGGSASEILYKHCFNRLHPEANIASSENRGCGTFYFYMDELCCGKIAISIQWDYRETRFEENSGSPVNRSWNVKIPSSRRNTHIAKLQDHPIRMHVDLRTRSTTFRHHLSYRKRIKVAIHPEYPEQTITIVGRKALCELLRRNLDIFTWKP